MFDYSVNFKAVDNISKKIDAINSKMSRMGDRARQVSQTVKQKLGNLTLASKFKLKTQEALQKVKHLTKKIKDAKESIQGFGAKAGAGGLAVLYGLSRTVKAYQDVAKAKGEVKSLGVGSADVDALAQKATEFSNAWAGVDTAQFISASYDIKSALSGLNDADIGKYTANVALVATATKASVQEMTDAFTLGSGVYKKAGEDDLAFSQRFGAVISASVQQFKTTGADVAQGIATIGKAGTALQVSLAEQMAVLGVSKESFKSMSEAGTSYKSFLNNVVKANDKMKTDFIDAKGKMRPFVEILEQIKQKTKGMGTAQLAKYLKDSFGDAEAVKIIQNNLANIDKIRIATEKLTEAQQKGLVLARQMAKAIQEGREFELMSQQVTNASASIGRIFAPVALKVGELIGGMSIAIQKFTKENPKLAKVIGYTVAILSGLAVMAGIVAVAMWGMSAPVMFWVGVVALVVGALVALYVYWGDIVDYFMMGMGAIGTYFSDTWTSITEGFTAGLNYISELWTNAMTFIFGDNQFQTWGDAVKGVFDMLTAPICFVIELIDTFMSKFDIYNKAKAKVTQVANAVSDKVSSVTSSVSDTVGSGVDSVKNFFGFGDDKKETTQTDSGLNTSTKNQSLIEVRVTAEKGASADTKARSTGGINLRNINSGK